MRVCVPDIGYAKTMYAALIRIADGSIVCINCMCVYLLFDSPPALLKLRRFHGGGASAHRFSGFRVRVYHPPRRFSGALVLDPHESVVE